MLMSRRARRAGVTLVELLVALALTALVVALTATIAMRMQRDLADATARARAAERLGDGVAMLTATLRGTAPTLDIDRTRSSDSTLELRATIATGLACGLRAGALLMATASGMARVAPGDTVLMLDPIADDDRWIARAITAVRRVPGHCASLRVDAEADRLLGASTLFLLSLDAPSPWDSAAVAGAVLRALTPQRWSFYRAADGVDYLGLREWQAASGAFGTVQPVSGPYRRGIGGSRFELFDAAGRSATLGALPIARIEARLVADRRAGVLDSERVVIAPRGDR